MKNYKPSARKIINRYNKANDFELTYGSQWYTLATRTLLALYPEVPLWQSAGITAALSPNISWKTNIYATGLVLEAVEAKHTHTHVKISGYLENRRKAFAIANLHSELAPNIGANAVINTLSLKIDGAPKTRAFFRNLCGDLSVTTVDTHAAAIAVNKRISIKNASFTPRQMGLAMEQYHIAADYLDIEPAILQAVVWVQYRHAMGISTQASTELFYKECLEILKEAN